MGGSVHGGARSFLLLFTVLGDTYPSIYCTKHSVASSNTVIYNENETLSLQSSLWPPPGPQDGLSQAALRLKLAKGRFGSKNYEKIKVLRMGLPIVENLSGPQESTFNLSRAPQLHFGEKSKNWSNFIKFIDFPPFPLFGVPWAAVICLGSCLISLAMQIRGHESAHEDQV